MNINLNLYKYFYEVAKHDGYTKAADALMISQPSLSYSVKVLEQELDRKLIIRGNKGIKLTKDGEELYNKLSVIFNEFNEITANNKEISGKITIGARSAFTYKLLPFYINELKKIYPNLEIDFTIIKSEKMLEYLKNEEVDIIIDEYYYSGDYDSIKIKDNYKMVFFTNDDNSRNVNFIDEKFLQENSICLVKNNRISQEIEKMYANVNFKILQSTPIMLNVIKDNDLVGLSPYDIIRDELNSGKFVIIESKIELPDAHMYVTFRKRNTDKAMLAVVDFFKIHEIEFK